MQYPRPVTAAIALSVLACLCGAFQSYGFETSYQQQNRVPYRIAAQFVWLAPLLAVVPENTELGYVTDAQPGSIVDSALLGGAEYVLAPRLVARDAGHDLVLGNFTQPADFAAFGRSRGLHLRQDFGNGVVLFQRERHQ